MFEVLPTRARRNGHAPLRVLVVLGFLMCVPWSAAAGPPGVEPNEAPAARFAPLPESRCRDLAERLEDALAHEVTVRVVPFVDPVSNGAGFACRAVATGTGEEFGSFLDVADRLREVLVRAGWHEDDRYLADGPTGTATAYRAGDARIFVNVGWRPAEAAGCPNDRPVFECDVAPAHQEFEITMTAVRELPQGAAPDANGAAEPVRRLY